jgi:starvation-inducible outer membrane lipoprotein
MKTTSILILALALVLPSCSTGPKPVDPFDAAIAQSLGEMMGGIIDPNAGGGL